MTRKKVVRFILHIYAIFTRQIPEGKLKKWVRLFSLKFKFFLFDEFSINKGETYFLVGTPNQKKIKNLSWLVGPEGRVILVEAEPTNIKKHKKNIQENNLNNVTLVPKAISNKTGTAKFLISKSPSGHRLVFDDVLVDNDFKEKNFFIDEVDVPIDTIDNIIEDCGVQKIDFLELAINGMEMKALKGMSNGLKITNRGYIKGHCINKATNEPLHVEESTYLKQFGFKIKITKPSPTSAKLIDWGGKRAGDIFAYRT